jgi:hypothetical protein
MQYTHFGMFPCVSRLARFDVKEPQSWLIELTDARVDHDRWPNCIKCGIVDQPFTLCAECDPVFYKNHPEYYESKDSETRRAEFTYDAVLTFECKMQMKPQKGGLAGIWEDRWTSDEPDGCQRVLVEHSTCVNDHAHYRGTSEGKAIVNKYFEDTFAWKGSLAALS